MVLNKKQVIMFVLLFSFLSIYLSYQYYTNNPKDVVAKNNLLDVCPDFDFEKFLMTGGSRELTSYEEIYLENLRLNYICGKS